MNITGKASSIALIVAMMISGVAHATPAKLAYDPVATAMTRGVQPEAASLALDEALAGAEYCPMTMDIEVNQGATVDLQLLAPCLSGQNVVLQYGLKTMAIQISKDGALVTSLPYVGTDRAFTVGFGDGRTIETDLLAPGGIVPADTNFAMR